MNEPFNNSFNYVQHCYSFQVTGERIKCLKQYTRNGKQFWRDYGRSVQGGIDILEYAELKRKETMEEMLKNMAGKVYE